MSWLFYLGNDRFKNVRVFGAEFRQYLAVDGDIVFFESAHEPAVVHSVGAAYRVDVDIPQGAKLALFILAIAVVVAQGLHHRLPRRRQF